MKYAVLLVVVVSVLAGLFGCGGSGGSGGGGTGGGTGLAPVPGQYLEFAGITRPGNLDPLQLVPGDRVRLVVANYDPAGVRSELPATFECSADPSQVTVGTDGTLRVLTGTPGVFRVTGRYTLVGAARVVRSDAQVPAGSATVLTGRVVGQSTGTGIVYSQVILFSASGEVVAGARAFADGTFRVQVPANATKISVRAETIPVPLYFRSIRYLGEIYTMDDPGCAVPLPVLNLGRENALPGTIQVPLQADGPPPPPTGCIP